MMGEAPVQLLPDGWRWAMTQKKKMMELTSNYRDFRAVSMAKRRLI
jgi:hypothetical protein